MPDLHEESPPLTPSHLMAKPAMSFYEFWVDLLGVAKSTAEEITRAGDGPAFFLIGRCRYVRKEDALAWIDKQAEQRPYFPRRLNRRSGVQA